MTRRWSARIVVALGAATAGAGSGAPDVLRGEQIYVRCMACHALANDRVGPHHCGLFGRLAGSVPNFAYSPAMQRSGIVWNAKTLDRFLSDPLAMVPRSSMTCDGIADAKDRSDLIAYLGRVNGLPACAGLTSKTRQRPDPR